MVERGYHCGTMRQCVDAVGYAIYGAYMVGDMFAIVPCKLLGVGWFEIRRNENELQVIALVHDSSPDFLDLAE